MALTKVTYSMIDGAFANVVDYGAVGDGATDCTNAVQSAVDAVVASGGGTVYFPPATNSYIINSVTSSAASSISLQINGTLKHKNNSTGDMFAFSAMNYVQVQNGFFDGNFQNQTARRILLNLAGSLDVNIDGVSFNNVHAHAIYTGKFAENGEIISITNCSFKDGVLHNGVINDINCTFIAAYPARITKIENCSFIQTAAPLAGQSRNPGGIFAGSNSETIKTTLSVKNCYFENLGHHVAGNIVGGFDVYSFRDTVICENNTFKSCRMLPLRVTNAGTCTVSNNTIFQDVDMIIDGSTTYTTAACITVGLNTRGFVTNERNNNSYLIQNNSMVLTGGGKTTRQVIYVVNGSTGAAYTVQNASVNGNTVSYDSSENRNGALIIGIKNTAVVGNTFENCNGVRFGGAAIPSTTGIKINNLISGCNFISDSAIDVGVHSRDSNANFNLSIRDCNFAGLAALPFTVRDEGNLVVEGCTLGTTASSNGDVSNLAAFSFTNNFQGNASYPTGYLTSTKYNIVGNTLVTTASNYP